jgi:hypothetical protein
LEAFLYRYSTNPAITILGGDDFAFGSGNVPAVPRGFSLPNSTDTTLLETGVYQVTFETNVVGALTSVSINLNGNPVPGGTAGALAATNEIDITALVEVTSAPSTITVSNNSFVTIGFPVLAPGSVISSLTILKLS